MMPTPPDGVTVKPIYEGGWLVSNKFGDLVGVYRGGVESRFCTCTTEEIMFIAALAKWVAKEAIMWSDKEVDIADLVEVRVEVLDFAQDMEERLKANDHKNGYLDMSFNSLLYRLKEETDKLDDELHSDTRRVKRIVKEAANVANFALMIAIKAKNETL